jgi:hypothetical protein
VRRGKQVHLQGVIVAREVRHYSVLYSVRIVCYIYLQGMIVAGEVCYYSVLYQQRYKFLDEHIGWSL